MLLRGAGPADDGQAEVFGDGEQSGMDTTPARVLTIRGSRPSARNRRRGVVRQSPIDAAIAATVGGIFPDLEGQESPR